VNFLSSKIQYSNVGFFAQIPQQIGKTLHHPDIDIIAFDGSSIFPLKNPVLYALTISLWTI